MAKDKKEKLASVADYATLLKPVITEKSSLVGSSQGGGVVFRVDRRATKTDVKHAVERIFNVEVDKVRTVSYLGKMKRTARTVGRRVNFKKAYVTLKPGFSIDLVEGV